MIPTGHPHVRTFALTAFGTLVLVLSSTAPACSSSNPAPPSSSTNTTTATGGSTTTTTTSSTSSTSTTTTGTGGGSPDSGPDSGDAGEAGPPSCAPDGGTGCFTCPQTNNQILNQCAPSGDQCTHFDNATRLTFWDGGALPPAP